MNYNGELVDLIIDYDQCGLFLEILTPKQLEEIAGLWLLSGCPGSPLEPRDIIDDALVSISTEVAHPVLSRMAGHHAIGDVEDMVRDAIRDEAYKFIGEYWIGVVSDNRGRT